MTASKLSRIQGRIAAAEAERAVLARAKALAAAAPAPKAAPAPQAIPAHTLALIAATEAAAPKAAPVAPVATRKASVPACLSGYSIPSPTLSEAAFCAALPAEVRGVTLLRMTAMRYYEENQ